MAAIVPSPAMPPAALMRVRHGVCNVMSLLNTHPTLSLAGSRPSLVPCWALAPGQACSSSSRSLTSLSTSLSTPSACSSSTSSNLHRQPYLMPASPLIHWSDACGSHQPPSRRHSTAPAASSDAETITDSPSASAPQPSQPASGKEGYSPLHRDIENFVRAISPTADEEYARDELIEGLRECVAAAFPTKRNVQTEVFGSSAIGLATWQSDVDLVVTGLSRPHPVRGAYEHSERPAVASQLRKIVAQVRKSPHLKIMRLEVIPKARIPIAKLYCKTGVNVDISISDDSGVEAARFLNQQVRLQPPMRPLVLVIKSYLKSKGLNDTASGGLSSYSLCNMVLAHIQEELKAGNDVSDYGELLYTFFLRYGEEFDYEHDAVSVRSGGIVPKDSIRFLGETRHPPNPQRLAVDCPLSGRNVSGGSFNIPVVQDAFYEAARKLESLAQRYAGSASAKANSVNYLSALFHVARVTQRPLLRTKEQARPAKGRAQKQQQVPDPEISVSGGAATAGARPATATGSDEETDSEIEVTEITVEESDDQASR